MAKRIAPVRVAACVTIVAAALTASGTRAPASPTQVRVGGGFYTIETTAAHYNIGNGDFVTQAPLRISRPGIDASADRGRGNTITGTAVMRGNVRIHDAGGATSPQGRGAEAATLTCDELDVDARKDAYRAVGHAQYVAVSRTASADLMVLDRKRRKLHLEGDVTITDGDAAVHAAAVDIDLARHEAVATGSPVIITQPAPSPTPLPGPTSGAMPSPLPTSGASGTPLTVPRVPTTASPGPS